MRFASPPPRYCSCCYGQYPQRRHVDFEATWDGPVKEGENGIKFPIDELVLCEKCLAAGARLIGYIKEDEIKAENEELGKLVEEKIKTIEERDKMIGDLSHSLESALEAKVKRPGGRPKKIDPKKVKVA